MTPLNFTNSDLKQKVDRLMDELWAGGVNNPMTAIEQISYLMFLKSLTELDEKQEQLQRLTGNPHKSKFTDSWAKYSWRTTARLSGDPLYVNLSEAFEKLHELPGLSQMGKELFRQAHLKIFNRPTLRSVVSIIDGMDYNNTQKYDTDAKGDLYEYLLSKIAISGTNGQFRTPRHIIKMMVNLIKPKTGQYILDPACGTAGFLIQAYLYIMEQNTSEEMRKEGHFTGDRLRPDQHKFLKMHALTGYDNDTDMIKISIMNLYIHGLENANVRHHDPLTLPTENDRKYDIILANPPFAGSLNKEAILEDFDLRTAKTELLFGEYFYKHLAPGGKAAVIVPEGVLFGSAKAHKRLRGWLLDECKIHGVISLPSGVFRPYAGVKTAILVFERGGKTEKVWFYEITGDGYSLNDKRTPQPDKNDIPDLLEKWETKPESERSWYATREEIKGDDDNLTAGRYKPHVHEEVEYAKPKDIITDVLELEDKINKGLKGLIKKVGK
jgi:type I restriction enzyme M protein